MLSRYYSYYQFEDYFQSVLKGLNGTTLSELVIGKSVLKRPIYGLKIGTGKIKVLAWSQMHGNESSTTRAICELLKSTDLDILLQGLQLYIIPVLNPDGAEKWTRVNANNVDLNRDAVSLSQPESVLLRKIFDEFQPDYCLNLHGQRTIYGSPDGCFPAQVSFLAPAGDIKKELTIARLQSMKVINDIYKSLEMDVSGIIGRYNDDFNINCVGDFMVSNNTPTILFEAGHANDDYTRDQVSLLMLKALKSALTSIKKLFVVDDSILKKYLQIPQISTNYVDILIRNYKSAAGNQTLSIQFHEQLNDGILHFVPILVGINRRDVLNGHRVIDLDQIEYFRNDLVIESNLEILSDSLSIKIFTN